MECRKKGGKEFTVGAIDVMGYTVRDEGEAYSERRRKKDG